MTKGTLIARENRRRFQALMLSNVDKQKLMQRAMALIYGQSPKRKSVVTENE
jgi:hypothetical protein